MSLSFNEPGKSSLPCLLPQVAAGMKVDLCLELYAIAVGVEGESGVGAISHDLEIITETDNLYLPIRANILSQFF